MVNIRFEHFVYYQKLNFVCNWACGDFIKYKNLEKGLDKNVCNCHNLKEMNICLENLKSFMNY